MKFKIISRVLLAILVICVSGCSNLFQGMANKTSDEALFEDIQMLMDQEAWDDAILKFDAMSDSFKTRSDVIEAWAGVYAGKCGLNFIDYFTTLGSANLGGTTIFGYFMNAWTGKSVDIQSCTLAHAKMEEISADPAERKSGQNLFLAVLGMVKIGVYLRDRLDQDNNGSAEINVCTEDSAVPPAGTFMTDAQVKEVVTGMGLLTSNLTYLTAVLSNASLEGSLDTVNTICNSAPFAGVCGKTNPDDVTASDIDAFRDLLSTDRTNSTAGLGVGSCVDPTVVGCCP